MKKRAKTLLWIVVGAVLCWKIAPGRTEPEKRVFPQALGVDYDREEGFELQFAMPDLSNVTGQGKEETQEKEKKEDQSYRGETIEEALCEYEKSKSQYLDRGQIRVLLLGDGILQQREKYGELVDFLQGEHWLRENVLTAKSEQMGEVMKLNGKESDSLGIYMEELIKDQKKEVTVREIYYEWYDEGTTPLFPKVIADGERILLE